MALPQPWSVEERGAGAAYNPPVKIVGYFDESVDGGLLCLAGFYTRADRWTTLDRPWEAALADEGIQPAKGKVKPEFHAEHCEHRGGAFKAWSNPAERERVYRRFVGLIVDADPPLLLGYCVTINLPEFEATMAPILRRMLPGVSMDDAYLLAVVRVVGRLTEEQQLLNALLRSDDCADVFFDEKDEFRGRALQLCEQARALGYTLGAADFRDSTEYPGLQMADVIAYESRKRLASPTVRRWQWERLRTMRWRDDLYSGPCVGTWDMVDQHAMRVAARLTVDDHLASVARAAKRRTP